jgi:hypothetical protein
MDVFTLVANLERFLGKSFTVANVARYVDSRQKVHFNRNQTIALAGLTATTFDVETKSAWFPAAGTSFAGGSK